jgi:integrase
MATVHDVAKYILKRQGSMSTWKLQKLVYYSQAWHLAWDEEPLFLEPIEAWANGPVVRALYKLHRGRFNVADWPKGTPSQLTNSERVTIDLVLNEYGDLTGRQLSALTHSERPWQEARTGLSPTDRSTRHINLEGMHDFYAALDADEDAPTVHELDSAKDLALWATALYAGLRRGELMGLHREEIDLATGVIRVERGWDQCEGEVAPKSKQGRRKVPIPAILRDRLTEYLMDGPESGRIFVGARDAYDRGRAAAQAAGVEPPTLHECRHGYAALMIAAGVNVKALSTFMGHANIRITLDQYGHLLRGAEDEAASLLDAFLARQLGGAEVERTAAKVAA